MRHAPPPPAADPESPPDPEVFDDAGGMPADDVDNDSELEELDEKEFEDFDPSALNIPDKPIAVDADNVGLLGVHKRKRTEEEERERKKKKKEGRREKTRKVRRVRAGADDDDMFEGGEEIDGKRARKSKLGADGRHIRRDRRAKTPEINEEELSPEERKWHSIMLFLMPYDADSHFRPSPGSRPQNGRSSEDLSPFPP